MGLRADDLWTAIDQLAREHGWTVSGLARKAGLDPTTFNRSKRHFGERDRWPVSSSIAKVLDATGESFLQFAGRVTAVQQARQEPEPSKRGKHASRNNDVRRMRQANPAGGPALGRS
jgi:phage repressor protein C with HTH and peptisase S24 domain